MIVTRSSLIARVAAAARHSGFAAVSLMFLALSGCITDPRRAYDVNQPMTAPVRNLTNLDIAYRCFDQLLVDYHVAPIYLTSTGIPNRAGDKASLNSGTDMLKTSIGQLGRSNVFRYVDLAALSLSQFGVNTGEMGTRPIDPQAIEKWIEFLKKYAGAMNLQYPNYIIAGSISQLDGNTLSDTTGGGLGDDRFFNFGFNRDQMVSVTTVDMQVQDSLNLQVINGMTTKNSLAIVRKGLGVDMTGRIKTVGAFFNVNYDRTEGLHQGIRDLIQIGTLELLGRLARVPYQQCLGAEVAAPGGTQAAAERFEELSGEEQVREAQRKLSLLPDPSALDRRAYYRGPLHGQLDAATRASVARYQRNAGLIASGQINAELLRSLALETPGNAAGTTTSLGRPGAGGAAPTLQFHGANGAPLGSNLVVPLQSSLNLMISADRPAHARCFLRDENRQIVQLFPTQESPDDRLNPGEGVRIPPPAARRRIQMDAPGVNVEVGCLVSARPMTGATRLSLLPFGDPGSRLKFSSLQEVLDEFRQLGGGQPIALEVLSIEVERPKHDGKGESPPKPSKQ